jgi:hypothetical protein
MNENLSAVLSTTKSAGSAILNSKPIMYAAIIGTWVALDYWHIGDPTLRARLSDALLGLGVAHAALTLPGKQPDAPTSPPQTDAPPVPPVPPAVAAAETIISAIETPAPASAPTDQGPTS